ncbi:hypothetical protein EVAR_72098_1 [Eumeta japonica]|uniref:Uncharacterized protein n=1 Tax=Eumeta variegata TaxID=151549 RepID=A0A4C2A9T1_EUMVA|nr:hypothetical protein EVAR_72098_1 [Eumeta japonica]
MRRLHWNRDSQDDYIQMPASRSGIGRVPSGRIEITKGLFSETTDLWVNLEIMLWQLVATDVCIAIAGAPPASFDQDLNTVNNLKRVPVVLSTSTPLATPQRSLAVPTNT